jgi:predicted Holliday junction resolvase-like endonuclease
MTLTDLLIILFTFLLGLFAAYLYFRQRISVIEERARNDLERWKLECTSDIRKDSVNRSRSTLKGKLSREERLIQKAVEEGRVTWQTIVLKDENAVGSGGDEDPAK